MRPCCLLLSALLLLVCQCCAQPAAPAYTAEEQALRRDIGQMLLVGFRGTELADTSHIVRDIRDYGIGGVILFEYDAPSHSRPRNITSRDQLQRLCSALQALDTAPLLIGIDQEGGRVSRLKEQYGFPTFASAKATAVSYDSVRHYARMTAETLHSLGINLNFAPCVDVDINPLCPVIGKIERSFSSNPQKVARCATIWMEEQRRAGVISCLKHFPGHGSSKNDTHLGLADVSDTWHTSELEPYRLLILADTQLTSSYMIMTTHVFNARFDSVYPATLSYSTLTGLLRNKLLYDGVIITDDLAMGAMTQQYDYEEMLRLTILAGADMLCLSNNGADYNPDIVPQTVDIIYRLVKSGQIPAETIRASAARIRQLSNFTIHQ